MKKISLALALLLFFSLLASCNEGDTPPESTTTAVTTTTEATTTEAATTTAVTIPLEDRFLPHKKVRVTGTSAIYPLKSFNQDNFYDEKTNTWTGGTARGLPDLFTDSRRVHLPEVEVTDRLSITLTVDGGFLQTIYAYDEDMELVASGENTDFLLQLEGGKKYYVGFYVIWRGEYISSQSRYETTSYAYAFCLVKK